MVRNREKNKKIRSTSGITMIALVITIIVLLILAAVSVATLTGENGILTRAQQAKIETEKAAIEEQIRLAILSAKAKEMGGNISIQDVLDELDKAGVDYETEEGEDGTTIIIDGDYVFDLTEKDGDIDEPSFQGTVDKPKPKIAIDETNYEDNTIEVKVSTQRNEQGTLEFYIKEEGQGDYEKKETIENAPTEYSYTFEVADKTKTYRIKVVALAKNGETAQTEVTVVGIPTLSSSNTTFTYTPTTVTNKNVTATITVKNINNLENYILQYSIGNPEEESSWKDYTKAITITQNGSVYARLKDKKKGQAGKYTKLGEISNIDRTGPVFDENNKPTATATTNSITITGSATDERGGIVTYQYGIALKKDTEEELEWTWEPKEGTTETEHTFTNLTQDKDYSLQMIAIDSLGNGTPSEILTISTDPVPGLKEEITDETTGLKTGNTNFTFKPEGWTQTDVTIKIIPKEGINTNGAYTLKYKTEFAEESGEVEDWTVYPEAGITLTRNQQIYAKLVDSTGQDAQNEKGEKIYATGNVDKIDKLPPADFSIKQTETISAIHGIELKDATDEIKQSYHFRGNLDLNTSMYYLYYNGSNAGDVVYLTEANKKGYYRLRKTMSDHAVGGSAPLDDTEYSIYLGLNYIVGTGTELKDATDEVKKSYQFIRSVDAYAEYTYNYNYDVTEGDLIYCSGGDNPANPSGAGIKDGYYKAIRSTINHTSSSIHLSNEEYWLYMGPSYLINSGTQLKDATEDIKQKNQFIRSITADENAYYLSGYGHQEGDIIYCSGGRCAIGSNSYLIIKEGYYRAIQTIEKGVYNSVNDGLNKTEYFEYLGPTYTLYISAITITPVDSVTDPEDAKKICSGIGEYHFSKDGGKTWVTNSDKTKTSYQFENLKAGEEYTFVMKAIDNAGNEKLSSEEKEPSNEEE